MEAGSLSQAQSLQIQLVLLAGLLWGSHLCLLRTDIYVGSGNPNKGPHTTSTFTTELSPRESLVGGWKRERPKQPETPAAKKWGTACW